jgi:hypothetical protein
VIPETPEAAWVNFNVPDVTDPPDVFVALAVKAANTDELIRAAPPTEAVMTMRILPAVLAITPDLIDILALL